MQIKDYDNYFINNYGTVYNKHLKELRKEKTKGGYKWEYVEMSETSWKDKKGYEFND